MLFATPDLGPAEHRVLALVEDLREKLLWRLHEPRRWYGSLRRATFARAIQGSNSIEGFDAPLDDAAAIDLGAVPLDADYDTHLAVKGYRDAMTFVLQISDEPGFTYSHQLLKSLHFMMTGHDLRDQPGRWRTGSIYVRDDARGKIVYEGPDVDIVAELVTELNAELNSEDGRPAMVRAAMAHLDLVLIHPFRDGNGRMSRCLQTLVLARQRIVDPVFSSVEEYLGRNTQAYYDVLAQVGGGNWQPERDARPWVRFMLTAHLRQARTVLRRVKESEQLWDELERLTALRHLKDRTIPALFDAATGQRLRNATYRAMQPEPMTDALASRDLRQLVESGLLVARGESRGRYYRAGADLSAIWRKIVDARNPRDESDPFDAA